MSTPKEPEAVDTDGNAATPNTDVGDVDMGATTMEGFKNSLGGYGGLDTNGLFICIYDTQAGNSTAE